MNILRDGESVGVRYYRVQVPAARGKVIPDIDSMRDDFPALWEPMTAIWGRSISICTLGAMVSVIVHTIAESLKIPFLPGTKQAVDQVQHEAPTLGQLRVGESNARLRFTHGRWRGNGRWRWVCVRHEAQVTNTEGEKVGAQESN